MARSKKHSSIFSWFYVLFIFALIVQHARAKKGEDKLSHLFANIVEQQNLDNCQSQTNLDLNKLGEMVMNTTVAFQEKQHEIKAFVEQGGDINERVEGDSIFDVLFQRSQIPELTLLVQYGFNLNAVNKNGATYLIMAVAENKTELAENLITLNVDVTTHKNMLLTMAFKNENPKLAALIALNNDLTLEDEQQLKKVYPTLYPVFEAILDRELNRGHSLGKFLF